jgi:hypothetical protein
MIFPFDYIGYKRLSENKRFPNPRWYSDATWGEEMGEWSPLFSILAVSMATVAQWKCKIACTWVCFELHLVSNDVKLHTSFF